MTHLFNGEISKVHLQYVWIFICIKFDNGLKEPNMPPELFVMVRTHYKQLKSIDVYRKLVLIAVYRNLQSIRSVLEVSFEKLYIKI